MLLLSWYSLPRKTHQGAVFSRNTWSRLQKDLDWIGALLISTSLAMLSYVLAIVSQSGAGEQMRQPVNLVLLVIGTALLPASALWMRYQTHHGRPALIPNELWANVPFTAVCITVFLVWGSLNASEQLTALYLQDVRHFSSITSSLYFLPAPVAGLIMNVIVAISLPYLRPSIAVPAACFVSGVAPFLLALLCRTSGPDYWGGIFQAIAFNPLGADLMYTIAMLVVTAAFPVKMQALAGGVFNMLAQIGKSVGIATTALIAQQITVSTGNEDGAAGARSLVAGYVADGITTVGWAFSQFWSASGACGQLVSLG